MPTRHDRETRLGVVGAGTMGSGIALTALSAGLPVALFDTSPAALGQADAYLRKHLEKAGKHAAIDVLRLTSRLQDLAGCDVIIEAAPEDLSLKQTLFAELGRLCPPPALLATNTSTLSVTAIASAVETPGRVAGLHFFNPASLMPLVEVARGAHSSQTTIETLVGFVEQLGKTPVVTADTPGFIVNRVARPFYGEALRILGEGTASHDRIDRIVELAGGFRMGPFRLMDLIGIDVNFAATRSMWEQTFGEPRYRPHPIQARMVQEGALGRKTGRGFYRYGEGEVAAYVELPQARHDNTGLVLFSEGSWAPGLAERVGAAGYALREAHGDVPVAGFVIAGREEGAGSVLERMDRGLSTEAPIFCQTCEQTLAEATAACSGSGRIFGFDGLFAAQGKVLTLVAPPDPIDAAQANAEAFLSSIGLRAEWIGDGAGLVLPRVMSMLANEAAFALAEGTADEDTIDLAMRLGANYPVGPLAWLRQVGAEKVLRVLEHLRAVFAEERYRVAPLLRRWANDDREVRS